MKEKQPEQSERRPLGLLKDRLTSTEGPRSGLDWVALSRLCLPSRPPSREQSLTEIPDLSHTRPRSPSALPFSRMEVLSLPYPQWVPVPCRCPARTEALGTDPQSGSPKAETGPLEILLLPGPIFPPSLFWRTMTITAGLRLGEIIVTS